MSLLALAGLAYALAVNGLAFALFGIDKRRAVAGAWRIRESTLIAVAAAGGWIGAKAGQRVFRHKTRKQPFASRLDAAGVVLLGGAMVLAAAALSPGARDAVARAAAAAGQAIPALIAEARGEGPDGPAPRPLPRRFGPGSEDGR